MVKRYNMTTEEKAKAYDEAIERMKSWVKGEHPECFTEAQKAAEFVFPELKGSEDEKIRKHLIDTFTCYYKDKYDKEWDGLPVKDIIAWLEKQGEQKPIIAENEKWLIDETLYFLDEFQQSDRCFSENEMQNSVTCSNWLKSLKERIG